MATGFASALSEGQPAQLDLGEEAVPCLVVGFSGADVVLAPGGTIPEDALAPGNTSYLLIEADGTLQALKARVRAGYTEGELVAWLRAILAASVVNYVHRHYARRRRDVRLERSISDPLDASAHLLDKAFVASHPVAEPDRRAA